MKYAALEKAINDRGIRKTVIAARLGIVPKTLQGKIVGKTRFDYEEVQIIKHDFFPDIPIDILFAEEGKETA